MKEPIKKSFSDIISLAKRRGFVYQTSEIYGGLANSYDYGPVGAELLRNIRDAWWKYFVHEHDDIVGLDSQIMLHPTTWVASGHVSSFTDPLVEDKKTHKRYRADHLIEDFIEKNYSDEFKDFKVEDLNTQQMAEFIKKYNIKSPDGNEITEPKDFSLLFETAVGAVASSQSKIYLRGETAQGIFTNFKQVLNTNRVKIPFGIAQIGKAFRNEITTGQFIFRTIEFEQAEIEYFFNPQETDWMELMDFFKKEMMYFVVNILGINKNRLRWRRHTDTERSFYSLDTYDLEYFFPFGWKELWGIAYRTDYDLSVHTKYSHEDLSIVDPKTNKKYIPHVIEPSVGVNRLFLAVLDNGFNVDKSNRIYLSLDPKISPYKVAVFPLLKNKPELVQKAYSVYKNLKSKTHVFWDDRGNIGKRYLYQDEIGTPYCITIDFTTLENDTVTIRHRDSKKQDRIPIANIEDYLNLC